ncbi:MAG TPA: hypothetical protein IAB36_06810 [Candidatus Egerieicola pullicola]|uniref:Uncharacterized protein n=1 Tax=Candidatus Egerieicola pullicola TaxID=2840775 RepID=A0A9D1AJL1_9FIRM|nr:hypothetical protein [Candidatus Egerieicola pullicola]
MASNREQDMMQMQQDAVRRVMEMQRQAQARVHPEEKPPPAKSNSSSKPQPPPNREPPPPKPQPKPPAGKSGLLEGILSNTGLDKEQLLLLGLGYLLYKEGADHKLLLSILYLLL